MDVHEIVQEMGLVPNPYGGWYRQIYCSAIAQGSRSIATIIHYLLSSELPSCLPHRTSADCVHFFHSGSDIAIRTVDSKGNVECSILGSDALSGREPQVIVPGGYWKEFRLLEGDFGLMSEAVVPGYIAEDDEVADPFEFDQRYTNDWGIATVPLQQQQVHSVISALDLQPNIEGGYYRQTYETAAVVRTGAGIRPLANTIYYLLTKDSPVGHFHLNRSDITHFFHSGGPIEYLLVSPDGDLKKVTMGCDRSRGEVLAFTCPGGWWKSSHLPPSVASGLISEMTAPGFRNEDHEMAVLKRFTKRFPHLVELCKEFIAG